MKNRSLKNITWYIVVGLACLLSGAVIHSSAQSFEEYKETQKQMAKEKALKSEYTEFEAYKESVKSEFESYKQIVTKEFKKYRRNILKKWEKAVVSTDKRWVEYSPNYGFRQIVDFEEGFIELEMIVDQSATIDAIETVIDKKLAELVIEDQKTAYQRDQFAQNIEREMGQEFGKLKAFEFEKRPILANVLTGTAKPSKEQVDKAVGQLKKKSRMIKKPAKTKNKRIVNVKTPLPPDSIRKKAMEYQADIKEYANRRDLDTSLVFAVIHTESAFNPMARSYVPAYGLMQIVPQSAGKDASAFLFGEPRMLPPSYLYNGQQNINIGTSYLYILFNRYLKNIKSPESRLYCAIAAYNTGAGNVAKSFIGTTQVGKAAEVINQMTPQGVYQHLIENLPYEETRHYLEKVNRRMEMYAGM